MPTSLSYLPLPPPSRRLLFLLVGVLLGVGVAFYLLARPLLRAIPAELIPGAPEVVATWLPDDQNTGGLGIGQITALDEAGAFVPLPAPGTIPVLNAHYLDARWFCFRITNRRDTHNKVVLDLVWQNYDEAILYQRDAAGGWRERVTGERIHPDDPRQSPRVMAFDLLLDPHTTTTFYLRVSDFTRLPAQFQLWQNQGDFLRWERFEFAKRIGQLGLLIGLAAGALFFYAMLHQRDQLHYVWIVLLNMVYALCDPSTGGKLVTLPGSPWREMILGSVGGFILIGYCRLTLRFFNLRQHDPVGARWVKRAQWALLSGVFLLPLPFWPGTAFVNLMTIMTLFLGVQIALLSVGVRRWRAGVSQAPLFVLALGLNLFGQLQFVIQGPDVVVRYDEQIFISILCNSACLLFLSMAAAYRYRLVIDAHLALRTDYTSRLESEVAERTRVLQSLSERLAASVAERDRILAIVGHDLRGPASSLQSLGRILAVDARSFSSAQMVELARDIEQACAMQLELLNNLLTWGGVQAGHVRKPEAVPVRESVEAAWKPLAAFALEKNILLVDACPPGLTMMADATLLQTILRNLLGNAIKFTRAGGRIEVGGRCVEPDRVELWVCDDGVGIDPERLRTLFNGPVQSAAGTQEEQGAGLGLSLCRDLARAVGGDIRLESVPGKGTRAFVTMPSVAPGEAPV